MYITDMSAFYVLTGQVTWLISNIWRCTMAKGYVVANIRVTDHEKFEQFSGSGGGNWDKIWYAVTL